MPTKPVKVQAFTAVSYSRLNDYKQCPQKAKFKHLDKLKEPDSPALAHGSMVHKLAEDYVQGKLKKLPPELQSFEEEFKAVKAKKSVATEDQWAFNEKLEECDWFGKDAWLRVVIDLWFVEGKIGTVIDHKTGKIRDEQMEQLEIYCMTMLLRFPDLDEAHADFWYLDQGEIRSFVLKRADLPAMIKKWRGLFKPMLADKRFQAKPGNACRFCHFRKANGGPCTY